MDRRKVRDEEGEEFGWVVESLVWVNFYEIELLLYNTASLYFFIYKQLEE